MSESPRVAIIGGGITGLSAASSLRRAGTGVGPRLTLVEAHHRLGGKIPTDRLAGMPLEAGPTGSFPHAGGGRSLPQARAGPGAGRASARVRLPPDPQPAPADSSGARYGAAGQAEPHPPPRDPLPVRHRPGEAGPDPDRAGPCRRCIGRGSRPEALGEGGAGAPGSTRSRRHLRRAGQVTEPARHHPIPSRGVRVSSGTA
jgi:NAD(P)-binding Rossmann-like domain